MPREGQTMTVKKWISCETACWSCSRSFPVCVREKSFFCEPKHQVSTACPAIIWLAYLHTIVCAHCVGAHFPHHAVPSPLLGEAVRQGQIAAKQCSPDTLPFFVRTLLAAMPVHGCCARSQHFCSPNSCDHSCVLKLAGTHLHLYISFFNHRSLTLCVSSRHCAHC